MKMAKASENDMTAVSDFFLKLEEMLEHGCLTSSDGEDTVDVDDARILEVIRHAWDVYPSVGCGWRRVVLGYDTVVKNACDPESSTLDWRKDLAAYLENREAWANRIAAAASHLQHIVPLVAANLNQLAEEIRKATALAPAEDAETEAQPQQSEDARDE